MYVDEQIILRDNLPDGLQRDFIELKAYYLAGKISKEDLNSIFRKYGIA